MTFPSPRSFSVFLACVVFAGSAEAERGKAVMEVERFSQAVSAFSQAVERGERQSAFKQFSALLRAGPGREIIQRLSELPGTRQLFTMAFPKGMDWSPVIAPDGSRFVYPGWQRGTTSTHAQLILVDMEAGRETPLTSPEFDAVSPQWSPDGRRILFESFRSDTNGDGRITKQDRRSLWVVDVKTRIERQWVDEQFENFSPQWMPEGKAIVWLSTRADRNGDGVTDRRDGWGLYALALEAGAAPRVLVEPAEGVSEPRPSPTGRWVVYQHRREGSTVLKAVSFTGGESVGLTPEKAEAQFSAFRPATPAKRGEPDGEAVAALVRSRDTNGDGAIDAFDRSAVWLVPLAHPEQKREILSDEDEYGTVLFSPDGQRLAVSRVSRANGAKRSTVGTGKRGVVVIDLKESQSEPISVVGQEHDNDPVGFLPDGRKVLFQSWRQDTNADGRVDILDVPSLYLVDVEGTPLVRISTVIRPNGTCTRMVELVTDPLFMETVKRHQQVFTGTKWQVGFVEGGSYHVKIVGEFGSPAEMSYADTPIAWNVQKSFRTVSSRFQERFLPLTAERDQASPLMQFAAEMSKAMSRPLLLHVRLTVPGGQIRTNGELHGHTVEWLIPFQALSAAKREADLWVEVEATNWPALMLALALAAIVVGGGGYRWWRVYQAEHTRQTTLAREYADAHQYLGLALAKKGLYDDALVEYREALKHGPQLGTIHFHMAQALAMKGEPAKAKAALSQALAYDSSLKAMVSVTEELKSI